MSYLIFNNSLPFYLWCQHFGGRFHVPVYECINVVCDRVSFFFFFLISFRQKWPPWPWGFGWEAAEKEDIQAWPSGLQYHVCFLCSALHPPVLQDLQPHGSGLHQSSVTRGQSAKNKPFRKDENKEPWKYFNQILLNCCELAHYEPLINGGVKFPSIECVFYLVTHAGGCGPRLWRQPGTSAQPPAFQRWKTEISGETRRVGFNIWNKTRTQNNNFSSPVAFSSDPQDNVVSSFSICLIFPDS